MASFMKGKVPFKYFENFIPATNQSCELGMKELLRALCRMRVENAVHEVTDVIELAILEVLLHSETFCVTEEDMRKQLCSYLTTSVLYCTPNLKARLKQILRETANVLTRTERHVIYIRNGTVHNLDVIFLRSEIIDHIAFYVERFHYTNESVTHNPEREQFRLSIACMKILVYAEQNLVKSAAASLQRSVNWLQRQKNNISENLETLFERPPSSWSTETVLKLHIIYSSIQNRSSLMFKLKLNIPLPTFSAAIYPSIESA